MTVLSKVRSTFKNIHIIGWAQWFTPVIPALCRAKMGRPRDQEIESNLDNMVKPHLH